jgi:AcrR family transcriptional regulator
MADAPHPTAEKLQDTVSAMLDGAQPHDILVDEVLKASGVSRGSLYHHFGDFPGLIQATLLRRFSANVTSDSAAMQHLAQSASTKEEYWEQIRQLSAHTQLPSRAPIRAERARIISLAASDPDFQKALAAEQDRLTEAMAAAIQVAQEKGWVNAGLSSHAIAVFLQAYSLGRAVDDIAGTKVSNEDWITLVENVLSTFETE